MNAQEVADTLWACAKMGLVLSEGLGRALGGRVEENAPEMNVRGVAITLWAYATMGLLPGEQLIARRSGALEILGWTMRLSTSDGQEYYQNTSTGFSTFDFPDVQY